MAQISVLSDKVSASSISTEMPHGVFDVGVAEQYLDGPVSIHPGETRTTRTPLGETSFERLLL